MSQWFVNLSNSSAANWAAYPAADSAAIEAAFAAGDKATMLNEQYKIDFNKSRQIRRDDPKRWRDIKREAVAAPASAPAPPAAAAAASSSSSAAAAARETKPAAVSSAPSSVSAAAAAPGDTWLPNDVVGVILSFLSARTGGLTDASAVCRQWHSVAAPRLDVELERGMSVLFVNNGRCAPDAPAAQYRLLWFNCSDRDMTLAMDARSENTAVLALLNQRLCDSVGDGPFAHNSDCEEGQLKFEWIPLVPPIEHERSPTVPAMRASFAQSPVLSFGAALRRVKLHQKRTRMDTNVIIVNQQLDMEKIKQVIAGVKIEKLVDTVAPVAAVASTAAASAATPSSVPAADYSRFSLPVLKALVSKAGLPIAAGSSAETLIRQLHQHDFRTKGTPIPTATSASSASAASASAKPTAAAASAAAKKKRKGDDNDDDDEDDDDDGPPAKKGRKDGSASGSASASASGSASASASVDEWFPVPGGSVHGCYSALLTQETKFIRLQVVRVGAAYYAYQRWGKLDTKGQSSNKACGAKEADAIKEFTKKFKEKTGCAWEERADFEQQDGKYDFEKEGGDGDDGDGGDEEEEEKDEDGEEGEEEEEEEDEEATRNLPSKRPSGLCHFYCEKPLPSVYNVFNNIHLLTVASSPLYKPCFVPIQEGARYQAFWHSYEGNEDYTYVFDARACNLEALALLRHNSYFHEHCDDDGYVSQWYPPGKQRNDATLSEADARWAVLNGRSHGENFEPRLRFIHGEMRLDVLAKEFESESTYCVVGEDWDKFIKPGTERQPLDGEDARAKNAPNQPAAAADFYASSMTLSKEQLRAGTINTGPAAPAPTPAAAPSLVSSAASAVGRFVTGLFAPGSPPRPAASASSSPSAFSLGSSSASASSSSAAAPLSSSSRLPWLPNDVIGVLLSFLAPASGLCASAAVCKQWRAMADPMLDVALERSGSVQWCSAGKCASDAPLAKYRLLRVDCYDRHMLLLLDCRPENAAALRSLHEGLCASVVGAKFEHHECEDGQSKFLWMYHGAANFDRFEATESAVQIASFERSQVYTYSQALRAAWNAHKHEIIVVNQGLDASRIQAVMKGASIESLPPLPPQVEALAKTKPPASAPAAAAPTSASAAASSSAPAADYSRFSLPVLKALVSKAGLPIAAGSSAETLIRQLHQHDFQTKGTPMPTVASASASAASASASAAPAKPTAAAASAAAKKKRKGEEDDDEDDDDDGPPAKKGRKDGAASGSASASASGSASGSASVDEWFPVPGGSVHGCYSALLTQETKFIRLQVVRVGAAYYAYQRWGKLDTKGQSSNKACGAKEADAIKEFTKKFKEKTGCAWEDRANSEPQDGKYDFENEEGGGEDEDGEEGEEGEDGEDDEDEDDRVEGCCEHCNKPLSPVFVVLTNIFLMVNPMAPLHRPSFVPVDAHARYHILWYSYENNESDCFFFDARAANKEAIAVLRKGSKDNEMADDDGWNHSWFPANPLSRGLTESEGRRAILEGKSHHFGFEPVVVLIRGEFILDKLTAAVEEECTFRCADEHFTEHGNRGADLIKPGTTDWPKDEM